MVRLPAGWPHGSPSPRQGGGRAPNKALEPTAPMVACTHAAVRIWRGGSPPALGPAGARQTPKTRRDNHHHTTGTVPRARQAKTKNPDGPDQRQGRSTTKDRDSSRRFGRPLSPTPDPASPALGHRAWGGTGQGRCPVWGLTWRWRRRATADVFWQAWGCTVWPAPQLGR